MIGRSKGRGNRCINFTSGFAFQVGWLWGHDKTCDIIVNRSDQSTSFENGWNLQEYGKRSQEHRRTSKKPPGNPEERFKNILQHSQGNTKKAQDTPIQNLHFRRYPIFQDVLGMLLHLPSKQTQIRNNDTCWQKQTWALSSKQKQWKSRTDNEQKNKK